MKTPKIANARWLRFVLALALAARDRAGCLGVGRRRDRLTATLKLL
jgi:hypothetical protein